MRELEKISFWQVNKRIISDQKYARRTHFEVLLDNNPMGSALLSVELDASKNGVLFNKFSTLALAVAWSEVELKPEFIRLKGSYLGTPTATLFNELSDYVKDYGLDIHLTEGSSNYSTAYQKMNLLGYHTTRLLSDSKEWMSQRVYRFNFMKDDIDEMSEIYKAVEDRVDPKELNKIIVKWVNEKHGI